MDDKWLDWQLEILDNYILNYEFFDSQKELAEAIGKPLNAVKIRLSRRRKQIKNEEKRMLDINEYKLILSNRFSKTTMEVAELLDVSEEYLLNELDEIDCLECKEYLLEDYKERIASIDEINVFIRLLEQGRNIFQIAHILNRPINKIEEMVKDYAHF